MNATEELLSFFRFDHLPVELAAVAEPFADLAAVIVERTPENRERTVALRKLLEAKDSAVRARLLGSPSKG
ncbi:MAG: hypothetical protein WAT93_14750 [Pontixanthobacter sp.]